jgi:guanylate cyclase
MAFGLILPAMLTVLLGGLVGSSAVILWSLITPVFALLLYNSRRAAPWGVAYLLTLLAVGLLDPLIRHPNNLSPGVIIAFFIMNLIGVSLIVILFLKYFIDQKNLAYRLLDIEERKSQDLLLNILPREIAAILKEDPRTIADQFDGASILFADLVGFTPLTARLAPVEMVNLLNEIFSNFDALVEKYDLEKIRTIGDNYMVSSGAPRPRPDHAQALARLALDMQAYLQGRPAENGREVSFRIGINSGPVIGGVIGRKKFVYDLWGDPVNLASRMESQGVPGKIQISEATYALIKDEFACEPRGVLAIKGKGEMGTWFLMGEKASIR